MTKEFKIADAESQAVWQMQEAALRARNQHRDAHMDFGSNMEISGFNTIIMALKDPRVKPLFFSVGWFWCVCRERRGSE
jgi:hypothetical protein